jgi:hypothetical protein
MGIDEAGAQGDQVSSVAAEGLAIKWPNRRDAMRRSHET